MDLFGSRDEDPLLQEDFESAADDELSEQSSPSPSSEESPQDQHSETERTIRYSQEEAETGSLSDLNEAFDREWRLSRVQLSDNDTLIFNLQRGGDAGDPFGSII